MTEGTNEHEGELLYVGIDWGHDEHWVCAVDEAGETVSAFSVKHGGDGLKTLVEKLEKLGALSRLRVALETTNGPIVEGLLDRGIAVYALNPKQVDLFRGRHSAAGAKDDKRDAYVIATSLRTDGRLFRALSGESEHVKLVRMLSRLHSELTEEMTRLTSRIGEQLWRYFPAFYELAKGHLDSAWAQALWTLVPTPERAQKVRPAEVKRVLAKARQHTLDPNEILATLRSTPLRVAPGTEASAVRYLGSLFQRVALIREELKRCKKDIERAIDQLPGEPEAPPGQKSEQRDARVAMSLPGVGATTFATLLAEAREPLERRDYDTLRALTGVAPVTYATGTKTRSGKVVGGRVTVRMRRACNERLRNAMHWLALNALTRDLVSRAKYDALRARGVKHEAALRTVADRLLYVLCAMLSSGTPFDRSKRLLPQAA